MIPVPVRVVSGEAEFAEKATRCAPAGVRDVVVPRDPDGASQGVPHAARFR
jgi:hypothetical protein